MSGRKWWLRIAFTALLAAAGGSARAGQDGSLNVVVTIKPVHSLVAQVMAGISTPHLIVEGKASPHSYALRPSDARALASADAIIRVSPDLEVFTRRLIDQGSLSARILTLSKVPGMVLLNVRRGADFEHDDHGHVHDRADHASEDDGGQHDLHLWLDPRNAQSIVRAVAETLAEVAPAHRERLHANAAEAIARLAHLDEMLSRDLAPFKERPFVVFHDAFHYFEHRYGLKAAGAITVHPEVAPSARRLAEVRQRLGRSGARCVFAEPQFPARILTAVTEGLDVRVGELDPVGADLEPGPDLYAKLMEGLAGSLTRCLAGRAPSAG